VLGVFGCWVDIVKRSGEGFILINGQNQVKKNQLKKSHLLKVLINGNGLLAQVFILIQLTKHLASNEIL